MQNYIKSLLHQNSFVHFVLIWKFRFAKNTLLGNCIVENLDIPLHRSFSDEKLLISEVNYIFLIHKI